MKTWVDEEGKIPKISAVTALVGGGIVVDDDGNSNTKITYHSGQTPPTEAQIDSKLAELQAEYDANQYQRDRQYPSIGEQLDMQYHDELDGTTTWKDAVAKVKADNPKPE